MERSSPISRRQLLGAGAVLLTSFPPALRAQSENGLLETTLEANNSWIRLGANYAHLFTYNGQVPGPRLEVRAGDTVRLQFVNRLAEASNLHFHGLHISPTGNADNVFLEVQPNESQTYEFTIPKDHRPGTYWYHPHLHGSSARQVSRGLAGLLVLRGEMDEIPEIAAANEHFLVLRDWALDRNGEVVEPSMMQRMTGREGSLITVGDAVNPKFEIQTGGMLRFRVLNASPSRFYRLKIEGHPMHMIASDGGPLPAPVAVDELLLSPGERADLLVQGQRDSGTYRLLNLPYNRGGMGMMGGPSRPTEPETLATMIYEGSMEVALNLPQSITSVEPLPPSDLPLRRFVLSESRGASFQINGRAFDHRRVDTQVKLGTIEDWEIVNQGTMDHPFHLHTNSFQILDPQGQPARAWKDVMLVPAGQKRRFRVRFADFEGKAVYHCHILDHEDLGMMGVIEFLA